ncbi:response regulator [Paenibacillus sp. NPDC057967]|uniref:response regulator transcription factor n=1 Tax=Paenibacillus sp. NPDC057967 TaxID=3346293 RepID=UPI0036DCF3EB
MKLKAMLVDDELPILLNLKAVLPWEDMGIEVAALARNGKEALQHFRELKPDLVLCDIRMPVMDGMAFLSEARKDDAECDFLMLTGYQEFEYAREALQRGVRDYILKPIDYEQLEQSVRQVCGQIRTRKQDRLQEVERWGRMASMAYEKQLYHALLGLHTEGESVWLPEHGMAPDRLWFSLYLADIDQYAELSLQWSDQERRSRNAEITGTLRQLVAADGCPVAVMQLREGEWCLIEQRERGANWRIRADHANERLQRLREGIEERMKLPISFVAYPEGIRMTEMESAYKKLQRMLLQSAGNWKLVCARDKAANAELSEHPSLWRAVDVIVSKMRKLDQSAMSQALMDLKHCVIKEQEQELYCAEKVLHYLLLHLLRELREMNMIAPQEEEKIWRKLQHSISVKNVMEMIIELVDDAMDKAFSKKTAEVLMLSAKDYIHRRLSGDLGVEELANYLGISVSYFSLLFKSHFGETFVEYVTRLRMEMAQSLLLTTDKTVTEIGSVSGYSERRYFTKVFQKFSGMTPSEYREHHQVER